MNLLLSVGFGNHKGSWDYGIFLLLEFATEMGVESTI